VTRPQTAPALPVVAGTAGAHNALAPADHSGGGAAGASALRKPRRPYTINCACCGLTGTHEAHGWRTACYARWREAGKPKDGPPPPQDKREVCKKTFARLPWPLQGRIEVSKSMREEYFELLDLFGLDRREAAKRLNISLRTASRYEARRREELVNA
jgi:hypothetical protein